MGSVLCLTIIRPEEGYLERFGDAYRAYRSEAPRWMSMRRLWRAFQTRPRRSAMPMAVRASSFTVQRRLGNRRCWRRTSGDWSRANHIALDGHAPRHRTVLDERRNSPHPCLPPARTPGGPLRSDAACGPHPRRPSNLSPLVAWLVLRVTRGGPQWQRHYRNGDGASSWGVRCTLFAVLLGQAVTGAIASYLWWPISSAHKALFWALVALLALHLCGAALSFAARPRETLFRITGLRLAR